MAKPTATAEIHQLASTVKSLIMSRESEELTCYNKGCGQTFRVNENNEDSCTFHPGVPFFHDAYKGWTCCNKKCTDFTEFLNFKGCASSYHTNVKPAEPEKPAVEKLGSDEVIEYNAPVPVSMARPPYSSPLVSLVASVSPSLVQQVKALVGGCTKEQSSSGSVAVGTSCKSGGCKATYEGPDTDMTCTHHPGSPVFHEGLKFWTCCNRKTSDFNTFLDQVGCKVGSHVWVKEKEGGATLDCRYDWHQTGGHVVVSIFAKKYDPDRSSVQLSPIRIKVHLFFPEEDCSFDLDEELRGVVSVTESTAQMFQTKVEIKLKKAEPGSWSNLSLPRAAPKKPAPVLPKPPPVDPICDEPVDLGDL